MSCFDWDSSLETGEPDIDSQHRGIFALANSLAAAEAAGNDDPELVTDAIYRLTDYVVQHFADEEAYMIGAEYPGTGPHRSQHEQLAGRATSFVARFIGGEDLRPSELATFVADWLRAHIRREDLAMVAFVRSSGYSGYPASPPVA